MRASNGSQDGKGSPLQALKITPHKKGDQASKQVGLGWCLQNSWRVPLVWIARWLIEWCLCFFGWTLIDLGYGKVRRVESQQDYRIDARNGI